MSDSELELMIVEDGADGGDDGADDGESDGGEYDEESDCDGDGDSESSDVSVSGARPNGDDEDTTSEPQDVRGTQRSTNIPGAAAQPSLLVTPGPGSRAGWSGVAPRVRNSGLSGCCSASQSSRSRGTSSCGSPARQPSPARGSPARQPSPARHLSSRSPSYYPPAAVANGACCAAGQPCAPPSAGRSGSGQAWPSTASQACPPFGPAAGATYPDKIGSSSSSSCSPSPHVTGASDSLMGLILLATAASSARTNES